MTLTKNIFTYVFLLFAISLQAQPDDLPSEEVKVIKDFEANLEETDKINLNPTMPVVDTTSQRLMYAVPNRNLNVNYLPPKIRPIAIKANPIEKAYNGYAKLGYGTPNSPFAAAAYHFIDPAKYNIGLQVKHHSANNKDLEHQRFMENFAQVDAIYHLSQGIAAEADLSFFNDVVHFYGYDHAVESFTKDQVRQRFNTLNFAGKIYNGQQIESDFNYEVGFDAYTISDNFASRENAFLLHLGASKWFAEQHLLNVKVKADFTSFKDDATFNNNIFSMLPKFTMHGDRFKFGLGANVVLNEKEFTVFPDVDAAFNILGKKLTAFAGWKGNLEKIRSEA